MDIKSMVNEDWAIVLEGMGEVFCKRSDFFVAPTLGMYAHYVYESCTREWVEDTVDPAHMFELKSVDEHNKRAIFAVKSNAADFVGEDITLEGQEGKLSRGRGIVPKLTQS